jgi:hypothetical protein
MFVDRSPAAIWLAACSSLASGCAEPIEDRGPAELVEAAAWTPAARELDVFADHRPAEVECETPMGYAVEAGPYGDVLEVDTGWCNYLTVTQPVRDSIRAGEEIEIRIWHFELFAPEPATAHLGVGLGGAPAWTAEVEIPSPSGLILEVFPAPAEVAAGEPIQFHLHNHGLNSWQILSITRL